MKLSRISLAILPLLSLCSVQAAVYNVVEIGEVTETASTYAAALNDNGDAVFNGAIKLTASSSITGGAQTVFQYYKFPIRLDAIDFDDENVQALFNDDQLNDVLNGVLNAETLEILLTSNPANQPFGTSFGFVKRGSDQATNLVLRDDALSRTNSEYLYDINNQGIILGIASATYDWQEFIPAATEEEPQPETEHYWVPEGATQSAYAIIEGQVKALPVAYDLYGGGYTVANAINEVGIIAGFGSVGLVDEAIENIVEICAGETQPVIRCQHNYHLSGNTAPGVVNQNIENFGYTQRAILWQLNDTEPTLSKILGFLGDKNSQQEHSKDGYLPINYYSKAFGINDSGIAVGVSLYSDSDIDVNSEQIFRTEHATLFNDTEALPMVDVKEWLRSSALAINNNDIAIGTAYKVINGVVRSKLFYFDYPTNQSVAVTGFFNSSNTVASAINDNNQVVGRGEVIIGGTTTRRNHGFVYDIAANSFADLNTMISCNSPYTIVDAKDINNNGVILATALVNKAQRDLYGDPILDSVGNPVTTEVTVAVKLEPIANGEVEDCATEQTDYERQGGGFSFGAVLLGTLLWWRRRTYH